MNFVGFPGANVPLAAIVVPQYSSTTPSGRLAVNWLMSAVEYCTPDWVVPDCAATGQASVALSRNKQPTIKGLKNEGLNEAVKKVVPRLKRPWHHFPQRVEG